MGVKRFSLLRMRYMKLDVNRVAGGKPYPTSKGGGVHVAKDVVHECIKFVSCINE